MREICSLRAVWGLESSLPSDYSQSQMSYVQAQQKNFLLKIRATVYLHLEVAKEGIGLLG